MKKRLTSHRPLVNLVVRRGRLSRCFLRPRVAQQLVANVYKWHTHRHAMCTSFFWRKGSPGWLWSKFRFWRQQVASSAAVTSSMSCNNISNRPKKLKEPSDESQVPRCTYDTNLLLSFFSFLSSLNGSLEYLSFRFQACEAWPHQPP